MMLAALLAFCLAAAARAGERGTAPQADGVAVPQAPSPIVPVTLSIAAPSEAGVDARDAAAHALSVDAAAARTAPAAVGSEAATGESGAREALPELSVPRDQPDPAVGSSPDAGAPAEAGVQPGRDLFDGEAQRRAAARSVATVPGVPMSRFEERLARVSRRTTPLPVGRLSLAEAPKFRALVAAERGSRWGSRILTAAGVVAIGVGMGVYAAIPGYIAYRAARGVRAQYDAQWQDDARSQLSPADQGALKKRVEARLDFLLADVGVPPWRRPKVFIHNGFGADNMSISGEELDSYAEVTVGDDWLRRSDEQIDGILAHELAHAHYGDTAERYAFGDLGKSVTHGIFSYEAANYATATAVALAALQAADPVSATNSLWLGVLGFGAGSAPFIVFGVLALTLGGFLSFAWYRLRERRADLFSVWMTGGRGILENFSERAANESLWLRFRMFRSGDHPSDAARAAYIKKEMGRPRDVNREL